MRKKVTTQDGRRIAARLIIDGEFGNRAEALLCDGEVKKMTSMTDWTRYGGGRGFWSSNLRLRRRHDDSCVSTLDQSVAMSDAAKQLGVAVW